MEGVTTLFMRAQSESLEREQEVRDESQPAALVRRAGSMLGFDPGDRGAQVGGAILHRMTAIIGGPLVTAVATRGRRPVRDAVIAALVIWLVFDEGTSWAMDPDQARAYPAATHLRGLTGHVGYGLTIGVVARVVTWGRRSV